MTARPEPEDAPPREPEVAEPDGLASALPDLLTAPVQAELEPAGSSTMSIEIIAPAIEEEPEPVEEPEPEIPALPEVERIEPDAAAAATGQGPGGLLAAARVPRHARPRHAEGLLAGAGAQGAG